MKKEVKNIIKVKKVPGIPGIRVVSGTGVLHNFPRHVHSDLCIGIITEGERIISIKRSDTIVSAGDIFVINPGEPHTCSSPGDVIHSYHVLIMKEEFIAGIAEGLTGNSGELEFVNFIKGNSDLQLRMRELADILTGNGTLFEKESMLYSFLEIMISSFSNADENVHAAVKRTGITAGVKKYIDDNYMDEISLSDLSRLSGVSPFHLNRQFCVETGISPHAYQIHRRIERSKEMLVNGESIVKVSLHMGFSDQSHFSRFFRRIIGTTPGKFIKDNTKD